MHWQASEKLFSSCRTHEGLKRRITSNRLLKNRSDIDVYETIYRGLSCWLVTTPLGQTVHVWCRLCIVLASCSVVRCWAVHKSTTRLLVSLILLCYLLHVLPFFLDDLGHQYGSRELTTSYSYSKTPKILHYSPSAFSFFWTDER